MCGPGRMTTGREYIRVEVPQGVRDLADGNPDTTLLPRLAEVFAAAAEQGDREPVLYGSGAVEPELARIARADLDADGVPDGPVTITSGSLDAIERVLAAHLKPGDAVAVEDPGWGSVLDLAPALGLRVVPVGVDDEGPLADDVRKALEAGRAGPDRHRPGTEPDRRGRERRTRACPAVRAEEASRDPAHRGRPRLPDRRPAPVPVGRDHPQLGLRAVGRQGVRPRPAARGAHRGRRHRRPGAGTAAAGAGLGEAGWCNGPSSGCGPAARWTPRPWRRRTGGGGTR